MSYYLNGEAGINVHQDLTHLLLTRFNTAMTWSYAPAAKGLDDAWLRGRIVLFETYCLPSVSAQRNAKFTWLVFCDAASPAWFRDKLTSYGSIVKPVYIEGPATDDVIVRSVASLGLVTTPYLITTRLDNDDAISDNHMALVQGAFEHQDREVIEFPFGLQSYRDCLYNVYWPSNPFLSLVEKVQADHTFTTILFVMHNKIRSSGDKVRSLSSTSPQWLQVLHGANLLNSLKGWPRVSRRAPANFTVKWPQDLQHQSLVTRLAISVEAVMERVRKYRSKRPGNA